MVPRHVVDFVAGDRVDGLARASQNRGCTPVLGPNRNWVTGGPMWGRLWKDPVWSKVIATGIVAAAGGLGAYLLGYWPVVSRTFSVGWHFLLSLSHISNWVIALLVLCAAPSVIFLTALAWHVVRGEGSSIPNWTSYKTDTFLGLRWRWDYSGGSIIRLNSFCPVCDYQVFARHASIYDFAERISFSCDSCHRNLADFAGSQTHLESKIERFIQQKIRNNTWRSTDVV